MISSTDERFKYLFFTVMNIHTMVNVKKEIKKRKEIVKKQNDFIFSSLVT